MNGPRLYYNDLLGARTIIPLAQQVIRLGRNSENLVVLNDPSISRFHAEIRPAGVDYLVVDLNSKNGTWINGERIRERKLTHGDRLTLGSNPDQCLFFATQEVSEAEISVAAQTHPSSEGKVGSHHLKMLLEVSKALNSSLVLEDVLHRVMDAVMELTGADRGFLMLRDAGGELQLAMPRNISQEELVNKQYRLSRSVVQRVIETDKPVIVCDSERNSDFREQKSVIALNLKTIMCVPLKTFRGGAKDTDSGGLSTLSTIGLIYVDKQTVTQFFSEMDLELFETVAGHAAIAIENARLHLEEIEKRRMDEELKIAREIQQTLLPRSATQLASTRFAAVNIPCRSIGGDYYDFIPLGNNQVGIVIADVSGKGPSAALLTSMVQGFFLAEASPDRSACETVGRVNHLLFQKNPSGKFVTVFYGVIDGDGTLEYCNAGHNPPLWIGGDGAIQTLTEGGTVLGIFDGVPMAQGKASLKSGDRVVFFTDGVTEAQSTTSEEYGDDRLKEVVVGNRTLDAESMKTKIMEHLMLFTAGMMQLDDITLIVAEQL
ncbi:MAG: SpoIIE family protein phosphatase [Acidobacteriia bacterium]|nr:SpoIIE family protein phosphatase [Terriglobia bacterium]